MKETILITGASSGIGKAFAEAYAEKGSDLILVARSENKLENIAHTLKDKFHIQADIILADLAVENAAQHIFHEVQKRNKTVGVLINNAGFGASGEFTSIDLEKQHREIQLNINTLVEMTYYFLDHMIKNKRGKVINLSSMAAFMPMPKMAVYAASKAFVLSFTEALYVEYQKQGIQFIAVCPGATDTNFIDTADMAPIEKMRTAANVVQTTFKALEKNKLYCIDGKANYFSSLLPRFLSRKRMVKLVEKLVKI